jgi:hypothetical protein
MTKRGRAALPEILVRLERGLVRPRWGTSARSKRKEGQEGRLAPPKEQKDGHRIKQTSSGRS